MRTRPETCLSDLMLDRLRLGELNAVVRSQTQQHLGGCAICSRRADQLTKESEAFVALPWVKRAPTRGKTLAALSALAAGILAVAISLPHAGDTRTKGGFSLAVIARRADTGQIEELLPADRVRPGDALRFKVTTEDDGYLVIIAHDATERVSVYYPQSTEAAPVHKGKNVVLEGAITADDTLGAERIVAFLCRAPVSVVKVVEELGAGCAETSFSIEKVPLK